MKKSAIIILAIFGGIFLLAVAANFVLPMFVSVDDYKGKIQAEFEQATGYGIEFGEIDLALLPRVHASAKNVRISNGSKILAEIVEINAYADPMLLIKGDLKVSSVDVDSPKIFLEQYAVGNNWEKKSAQKPSAPSTAFSIEKINVSNGALSYDDNAKHVNYQITEANLSSAFESWESPIAFAGELEFAKNKFSIDAKIDGDNVALSLDGMDTQASFAGTQAQGEFKITSADINKVAVLLGEKYVLNLPKPNIVANGNFTISEASNYLDLQEFKLGDSSGAGKIIQPTEGKITADIKMENLVAEDFVIPLPASADGKQKLIPDDLKLRLSLTSKQLKYRQLNLSNLDLQTEMVNGEVVIQPVSFNFEDGGDFEVFGVYSQPTEEKKIFEGKLQASGKDLRKLMVGYGIDISDIDINSLRNFSIDTNLFLNFDKTNSVDLSGLQLNIDDSNFSGSALAILNSPPEITIRGSLNRLNLDELMVEKQAPTLASDVKAAAMDNTTLNFDALKNLSADLNLAFVIEEFISHAQTYQNLQFVASAEKGEMEVQNLAMQAFDTNISGNFNIDVTGYRPNIIANLSVGDVVLPARAEVENTSRWSQAPISLSPLDEIDGEFNINLLSLQQDDLRFDNVSVRGNLSDTKLNIVDLSSRAFGGELNVVGNIGVGIVPEFNLKIVGDNVNMLLLANQLAGNDKLGGMMNFSGNLTSSGGSELALVQNLSGAVSLAGTNIIVYGFDLEGFVNKLANINNPLDVGVIAAKALNGAGETLIAGLEGSFGVDKGVANTQGLNLVTRVGQGIFKGDINLVKWEMDTNAYFAINFGDSKELPRVGARMYGPIDNFKRDYDYSEIVSFYSKRFGLSDKIGNAFDEFLTPKQ